MKNICHLKPAAYHKKKTPVVGIVPNKTVSLWPGTMVSKWQFTLLFAGTLLLDGNRMKVLPNPPSCKISEFFADSDVIGNPGSLYSIKP